MQLASVTSVAMPTDVASSTDVVPPSQLFALAGTRFYAALEALSLDVAGPVPDARATQASIYQALSGVRLLRSTLVPSTPFHQRQAAASAIDDAQGAVHALSTYERFVARVADGDLVPDRMPDAVLELLEQARSGFASASNRIA